MSGVLAPQWLMQALTDAGAVASGALLYSYVGGGGDVPSPLYEDKALTTPLANPYEFDSAGRGQFWLDPAITYRLRLETATGDLLAEQDGVEGVAAAKDIVTPADLPYTTLEEHGAVGDGVTNDYPAWELAMASLASDGVLQLDSKAYSMDPTSGNYLSLPANVTLRGNGPSSIIYLPASGSGRGAIKPFNGTARNVIESLRILGPGDPRTASAGSSGIFATGAQHLTISNVEISGVSGAGINLKNATDFVVEACYVHDTGADGIHMPSKARRGNVYGNICEANGDDAISVVGYRTEDIGERINIFGNVVTDGHKRGITVIGGRKVNIYGNHVENFPVSGIYIASESAYDTWGCEDITITGNTLYRIGRTYNSGLGSSVYAYAAMLSGRSSYRSRNISFCDNVIMDCSAISGGTANGSTNLIYAQYTDGVTFSRNRTQAGPFQEVGDTAKTKRFAYILNCSNIAANENSFDTCEEVGIYLDSNCTGWFEASQNKFKDAVTDGGLPVIQIDSTALSISITRNIESNPSSSPTYFVSCPSGVADPTTTDVSANMTTLSNFNVPASSSAPVTESETFADLETSPQTGRLYIQKDRGLTFRGQGAAASGISNATGRNYTDMTMGPDGALWCCVYGGGSGYIYRGIPNDTTGAVTWVADTSAVALGSLNWRWIKCVGKRLYAGIESGTIYQATVDSAGAATWTTTGATSRAYRAACRISDTEFLTTVDSGDIYKGTIAGATVTLTALSASSATRQGIAYIDGWVWYTISGTDIYRAEYSGGVLGTPVAQSVGSSVAWRGIAEGPDRNIYATTSTGMWRGVVTRFGVTWADLALATSTDRRGMAIGPDHRLHIAGYAGVSRFYKTAYVEVGK